MKEIKYAVLFIISIIPAALMTDSILLAMLIWVGYMIVIGALYLVYDTHKQEQKRPELEQARQKQLQSDFYLECKKNGITSLSSAMERQKAELIAKKLNVTYESLEEYFKLAKDRGEAEEHRKNAEKFRAEMAELRKAEAEKHAKLTKYASYFGRNKRIAMLTDIINDCESAIDILNKGMQYSIRGSQQKEIDWATHGGIAAGIAGGAAGVAVAADIQAKNAQIRAQNKANLEALKPTVAATWDATSKYQQQAQAARASKEEAAIKLVAESSSESALSRLSFQVIRVNVSKTGAFELKATVQLKKPFTIFETVNAVVDGTVSADLYQNGGKVGSALLVLPTFGVGEKVTIEGIGLSGAKEGVPYEVKFAPYKLWEMEA